MEFDVPANRAASSQEHGVKFDVVSSGTGIPASCRAAFPTCVACGSRLAAYDLTPESSGNLSIRIPEGMIITSSGSHLSALRLEDLVLVTECDDQNHRVFCSSGARPSSETFLHWRVLHQIPAVGGIVHVHGDLGLPKRLGLQLRETPREVPYGSQALSRLAAETVALGPRGSVIILKNHGFLALGATLFEATDLLVDLKIQAIH